MFDIFAGKDPQKALQRAHEYIKEGKPQSAIKTLRENLTEGEESFDLYIMLARLYFETEQRPEAVEILKALHSQVPSRSDEVVALLSDFFFRYTSIDAGDFLLQLYVANEEYDDVSKVLRSFNDREVKLLLTRYDKISHVVGEKKVIAKKDFDNILILCSILFFIQESKNALDTIEMVAGIEGFHKQILNWARTMVRERFNDPYALLMLLKLQVAHNQYEEALAVAQRYYEKFPNYVDSLLEVIVQVHPPTKDMEAKFSQLLTELYVKKGDLNASIDRLQKFLAKNPNKVDDVIKTLRELQRIYPKDLKVLFAMSDTLLNANRVSQAINEFEKILEIAPDQQTAVLSRYETAFKKEPDNPHVIQGLVAFNLKQNKFNEAVDVIETAFNHDRGLIDEYVLNLVQILERDIDNPRALYLLGLCYAHKGEVDNAVVVIENLTESKKYDLVDRALNEIMKLKPDEQAFVNLHAQNLINLGKETEALKILEPHLEGSPEKVLMYLPNLDRIVSKHPELAKKVIEFYETGRKTEPFIFDLALARVFAYAGNFGKSIKKFEECLEVPEQKDTAKRALLEVIKERPKAVPLLLAAARVFMKDGEVEIATHFFKTAQMIDPKAFFEIVDEFYDTLKTFPKDREVRTLLIDTFFTRKLYDRVIEEAKKGIEVFGRDAQYFNLKLGQALVEGGNLSDGVRPLMLALDGSSDYSVDVIKYLDKILAVDKSNVPAHFARGRALAKAKRLDESVEEYLLTARIVPARAEYVLEELKLLSGKSIANPKIIFATGNVEVSLKKYSEGIKHILQSCELDASLVNRVIPIFERLLVEVPSPALEYSLARVYHMANLRSSAIKYYISAQVQAKEFMEPAISEMKRICAEDPKDGESRKGLAQIFFNYNNLEDALTLADEIFRQNKTEGAWVKTFVAHILGKNPAHVPSYYLMSYIFLQEEDYAKAIDVFYKLIHMSPGESTNVIKMLGEYAGKSQEVLFHTAALKKDVGSIKDAVADFGLLFDKDVSYCDQIIAQIKEILMKNVNTGEAYLLQSKILSHKKEYDKAIESLEKAERLLPASHEEIMLRKAQYFFEKGAVNNALEIYNQLLKATKNRLAIYRMIKRTRDEYLKEKLDSRRGEQQEDRLTRANILLAMGKIVEAEKELKFTPKSSQAKKDFAIIRAKVLLRKNKPIDALEMIRNVAVDPDTATVYADIYEAMGSYEAAAAVLKETETETAKERIRNDERLAQEKRLGKGRYFVEGRI